MVRAHGENGRSEIDKESDEYVEGVGIEREEDRGIAMVGWSKKRL